MHCNEKTTASVKQRKSRTTNRGKTSVMSDPKSQLNNVFNEGESNQLLQILLMI